MMDRNERIADIVAELRKKSYDAIACGMQGYSDKLDDLAERIEAAAKRETVAANAAKLREVADSVVKYLGNIIPTRREIEIIKAARAALAAPPRNCDVGTADEQLERHRREVCDEYENSWEDPRTQCNGNCKACFARWLLAPAVQEGDRT